MSDEDPRVVQTGVHPGFSVYRSRRSGRRPPTPESEDPDRMWDTTRREGTSSDRESRSGVVGVSESGGHPSVDPGRASSNRRLGSGRREVKERGEGPTFGVLKVLRLCSSSDRTRSLTVCGRWTVRDRVVTRRCRIGCKREPTG